MVRKNNLAILLLVFSLSFNPFVATKAAASNMGSLTIFSESGMAYVMTKIARNYSKKENIAISINFNSSSELIGNIDLGEPAALLADSAVARTVARRLLVYATGRALTPSAREACDRLIDELGPDATLHELVVRLVESDVFLPADGEPPS